MSIATAIQNAQQKVANAYTAISNKGGTLPATQDLSNMPAAINSIPSGTAPKFGATVDTFLGSINVNGVYTPPPNNIKYDIVFNDLKKMGTSMYSGDSLAYKFFGCNNIKSISFPDLEYVYYFNSFEGTCKSCFNIESISFPKLKIISGDNGFIQAFYSVTKLLSFSFPELTEVSANNGFDSCFYDNVGVGILETASFPKLETLTGRTTFVSCFGSCRALKNIYFNALKTTSFGSYVNQFYNMFNSATAATSGNVNIHFPSNLQSTIAGLTGYPNFGATAGRVTLLFDLAATN